VSIGASSRRLVLSIAFGLQCLIDFIVMQGESVYYFGGFIRNCTPQVRYLSCVLAMASGFSDAVLMRIMRDDRDDILEINDV
jgi:hypothetical protein